MMMMLYDGDAAAAQLTLGVVVGVWWWLVMMLQLQDKNWKIQVEKSEKDRLKTDFHSRLQMNNKQWEKNLVRLHLIRVIPLMLASSM